MSHPRVTGVQPYRAIEGGRIRITGSALLTEDGQASEVWIGGIPARVVYASSARIDALVPSGIIDTGPAPLRVEGGTGETAFVQVGSVFATGLHQVDSPVFDQAGNLYVTFSGARGQQVPVSIFRVRPDGTRETFSTGIVNPTSMAVDAAGRLYVSSRLEGSVYRLLEDGSIQTFATDLGVACGLAFASDGALFVGDRSGTIFRVDGGGRTTSFATLPASVAAFHLAFGRNDILYVTAPTLSPYDVVYQVDPGGRVTPLPHRFGRPQGIAIDASGALFVVEALAGASGLYRVPASGEPELVLAGPNLIGVAFDRQGTLVVCSNETAYRLPVS
jgi:sugar lactone lactonase YvrE